MAEVRAAPEVRRDPVAEAWPDDPSVVVSSFTVEIGLGGLGDREDDVCAELSRQLAGEVRLEHDVHCQGLLVTLVISAADVWVSLLTAMATIANTGYSPTSVTARAT